MVAAQAEKDPCPHTHAGRCSGGTLIDKKEEDQTLTQMDGQAGRQADSQVEATAYYKQVAVT